MLRLCLLPVIESPTTQSLHVRVGPRTRSFLLAQFNRHSLSSQQMATQHKIETEKDPRIVSETGLDARVAEIVEPVIEDLGFRLVRVRISGLNGMTVQIMVERPDGTMGVHECEEISRNIAPSLDVEDPISGAYHLEVSSPGVDRPLVRSGDFSRWAGHVAKLELSVPNNGRRRYRGTLLGTRPGERGVEIGIELPDVPEGEEPKVWLPLDTVGEAKLIMTDKLMEEAAQMLRPS